MTAAAGPVVARPARHPERPSSGDLVDALDLILDKGLVIDASVRVSLVGVELLTIDARTVVAGVETYLRFAEAVNRLDLAQEGARRVLPPPGDARHRPAGAIEGGATTPAPRTGTGDAPDGGRKGERP